MRCKGCRGEVKNVDGRRLTIPQLTEVHRPTCPAGPKWAELTDEPEPEEKVDDVDPTERVAAAKGRGAPKRAKARR